MSKNKSYMPNGGYTLTQGSNYMMDGFHFDTEYGGGPQEKARLPEARGLSDLPSGMIPLDSSGASTLPNGVETEVDLNLEEITREASQEINLIDHSWLASQPKPDLSGLTEMEQVYKDLAEGHMNNPSNNQLKALEESWGQTSTTGLDIIPNENRAHEPYRNSYRDDQSRLPGDDYRERLEKNVRKLAYGTPLNQVLSEVHEEEVLEMKAKLANEYGLHGQVYIKESAFPGLFNGRWDEVIKKRCATAMYIIPKSSDCAYDRFLGMEVVTEVPWSKAAHALLPKLESYGVRIASGSAMTRLQSAFIDLIEGRVARQEKSATWFPTQEDQSSLISLDHARRELENAREENIFVASMHDVEQSKIEQKLHRVASQLVKEGFLETEQVEAVVDSSDLSATKKIERLYHLASQPVSSSAYEGQGKDVKTLTPHRSKIEENYKTRSELNLEQRFAKAKAKIARTIKAGLISTEEANEIIRKHSTPEGKVNAVFKRIASKVENTSEYAGQGKDATYHNLHKRFADADEKFDTQESRNLTQRNKKAQEKVAKMIQTGLITLDQVEEITKKASTPEDKVRAIYTFLARPDQVGNYQGEVQAHYMTKKSKLDPNATFSTQEEVTLAKRNEIAMTKLSRMVKAGLVTYDEIKVATQGKRTPEAKVASVFKYLATPQQAGSYQEYELKEHRMVKARNKPLDVVPNRQKRASAQLWKEAHAKVDKLVSTGLLSQEAYDSLQGIKDANAFVRKAFDLASTPSTSSEYQGDETAHILGTKKSKVVSATEQKVATWIRQKISEGAAGQELDVLIATRFNQDVVNEYRSKIASIRAEHEGLSGHAYVDASAYMTVGVEGCDKGALVHRANQIPTLLKTSKCGSCVFNTDGSCQKYNKPIVASVNEIVESPKSYQKEMIRLANASDSEQTASLFVNNYDANEFNLTASDHVSVDDAPSNEQLGDVLFGGFDV